MLGVVLFAFFSVFPSFSSAGETEFTVMSYNVKGLPWPIAKNAGDRLRAIGDALAAQREAGQAPDVVVVQEAFVSDLDLFEHSGYPEVRIGATHRDAYLNSGLMVLSEHEIVSLWREVYWDCLGWDCFASKGVLMVTVAVEGVPEPIQVLTTHMNANEGIPDDDAALIRSFQLDQLSRFVDGALEDYPTVFGGDFNISASRTNWGKLRSSVGMALAGEICLANPQGCDVEGSRASEKALGAGVDHQFFRSGASVAMTPVSFGTAFDGVSGPELSDHIAVVTTYRLSW